MLFVCFLLSLSCAWALPSTRIIGGTPAYAGEFPYAAAIYITTETGNYFCTGSILTNQWILTAGQCVDGGILFTIIMGTNKLDGSESTQTRVAADLYVLHPEYDPLTLANDIGLIKLRMPVEFTTYIRNLHLPFSDSVYAGATGSAYGWGQISDSTGTLASELNHVILSALSDEECRLTYGSQVKDTMACFSGNYNEGSCYGDSGSPVIQVVSRGYTIILAVSTFFSGNGCESTDPSGYTRVWPYNDWINEIIKA